MLKCIKVAVTGGIGAGKSSVCLMLKKLGAYVVNSDEIAHKLLVPSSSLGKKIVRLLGKEVVKKGRFDRAKIAKVFDCKEKLLKLEKLIHPQVFKEIRERYKQAKEEKVELFVVEIPLLFETKKEKFYNYTIAVIADENICASRSIHFNKRKEFQMSMEEKAKKADFVITNNSSKQNLRQQVRAVAALIKEMK